MPDATSIGTYAFAKCYGNLHTISLPQATEIKGNAFDGCTGLYTASLPLATSIAANAFNGCKSLTTLQLGATPPTVANANAFTSCPTMRFVQPVNATSGQPLTGSALTTARNAYKAAADGNTSDALWYGWRTDEVPGISVYLNGVKYDAASLHAAIAAKGGNPDSLRVVGGYFTDADWSRLNQFEFSSFIISPTVTEVADLMLGNNTLGGNRPLNLFRVAKLKKVGADAFHEQMGECGLTTLDLPDCEEIGENAFSECYMLTSVNLPKVNTIGAGAFSYCPLTEVELPNLTTVNGFDHTSLTTLCAPKASNIAANALNGCATLTTLKLGATPPTVVNVATAFKNCPSPRFLQLVDANGIPLTGTALTTAENAYKAHAGWSTTANTWYGFTIGSPAQLKVKVNGGSEVAGSSLEASIDASGVPPASITTLKLVSGDMTGSDWQFLRTRLTAVTTLTMSDAYTTIPAEALRGHRSLTTVDAPNVSRVGALAFFGCSKLTSVTFQQVTYFPLGNSAFESSGLVSIKLFMDNKVPQRAFYGCSKLQSVDFSRTVGVEQQAFGGSGLTSIHLPKAKTIGADAFWDCSKLTTVSLPAATTIGEENATWTGGYAPAFRNCPVLTTLKLGATPPTVLVGTNDFTNCPSPRYLQLVDADGKPLTGTALNNAIAAYKAVDDGNTEDNLWYGWLINEAPSQLKVMVNGGAEITCHSLQEALENSGVAYGSITSIAVTGGTFLASDWIHLRDNASTLNKLKSFTIDVETDIPTTTTTAPYFGTALEEFSGSKVKKVGWYAFYWRTNLTKVSLPAATDIEYNAFEYCTKLTEVYLPVATKISSSFGNCTSLTSICLPAATTLANGTFFNCTNLTTVVAPSVTTIADAFSSNPSLRTIYLGATPPTVLSKAFDPLASPRYLQLVGNSVLLMNVGPTKLSVVKAVQNVTGLGLKEAKDLVDAVTPTNPQILTLTTTTTLDDAISKLETARAKVMAIETGITDIDAAMATYRAVDDGNTEDNLWYGWRINETPAQLKVKVNGGDEITAGSLQEALAASSIDYGSIETIEIIEGDLLGGDWTLLASNTTTLSKLTQFTINTEAKLPDGGPFFGISLQKFVGPKVTAVGANAFKDCAGLASVELPQAITIGNAFRNCTSLTTINLPKATSISGFYGCTELVSVSLPVVTSIASSAFKDCAKLSKLQLGAIPPTAARISGGNGSFDGCPTPRTLELVDADGQPLRGSAFETARAIYLAIDDGDIADELWHGWSIKKPAATQYSISTMASPTEGGTVSGAGSYTVGSTVALTATANSGYRFVRWTESGTEVSTSTTYTFTCTGSRTLVAVFEKEQSTEGEESTGLLDTHRESLSIYPNPTHGELWVTVPSTSSGTTAAAEVLVYTASGQLVVRVPMQGTSTSSAPSATGRIHIDLSGLPSGMYIIRVGNAAAKVVHM